MTEYVDNLQVAALKQMIEQKQGPGFPASNLHLIYTGKDYISTPAIC